MPSTKHKAILEKHDNAPIKHTVAKMTMVHLAYQSGE